MVGADPPDRAQDVAGGGRPRSELAVRIISAIALAPLPIAAALFGGWPFLLLCTLAAIGIWWEWATLAGGSAARLPMVAGGAALVAATLVLAAGWLSATLASLALGAVLAGGLARKDRAWMAAGVGYAGTMLAAPVLLRRDPDDGLLAIIFLFAVVWTTDIAAYFAGRALSGPKLEPRLRPKKAWWGARGGAGGAVIAAILVATIAGTGRWAIVALVALVLSAASQAGDLFESGFKRRYGAKDASQLIPGHGGLMDRLDGFIAAALAATILGLVRGGADAPARGLLVW